MGNERVYCVCAQGVDELNMRMGHAPGVEGFVAKMQHAQVSSKLLVRRARPMHSSEYSGSCSEKGIKRANGICVRPDANILHAQGVDELNMRMGHAQQVEGFVHNMQHAQVQVDNF